MFVLQTKIYTSSSAFPIETFFGIPYALAPTGRHRFAVSLFVSFQVCTVFNIDIKKSYSTQAPERHPGWRGTLYARRLQPRCPQPEDENNDGYFNEDCLYLNICTPRVNYYNFNIHVCFYIYIFNKNLI